MHNKTFTLGKIFMKLGYEDNDEDFFNDENVNKVKFYTNKNTIFISNDEVYFNVTHDYEKQELLIENDIKINIFNECIIYKEQLTQFIEIMNILKSKNNVSNIKEVKKIEEKKIEENK
jgi:hypothetical protein